MKTPVKYLFIGCFSLLSLFIVWLNVSIPSESIEQHKTIISRQECFNDEKWKSEALKKRWIRWMDIQFRVLVDPEDEEDGEVEKVKSDMFILIISSNHHSERRYRSRLTWIKEANKKGIKVLFIIEKNIHEIAIKDGENYDDTILVNFKDSIVIHEKMVKFVWYWTLKKSKSSKFILIVRDSDYIVVDKLLDNYKGINSQKPVIFSNELKMINISSVLISQTPSMQRLTTDNVDPIKLITFNDENIFEDCTPDEQLRCKDAIIVSNCTDQSKKCYKELFSTVVPLMFRFFDSTKDREFFTEFDDAIESFTNPVINQPNICLNRSKSTDLVIFVKSHVKNKNRIEHLRKSWLLRAQELDIPVLFVYGTNNKEQDNSLKAQAAESLDIIQADYLDTYPNITRKTYFILWWSMQYCSDKSILIVDDDTFVNMDQLIQVIKTHGHNENVFYGNLKHCDPPYRKPGVKYYLPNAVSSKTWYPAYLSGGAVLYTSSAVKTIYSFIMNTHYPLLHKLDDVFIYRVLAQEAAINRERMPLAGVVLGCHAVDQKCKEPVALLDCLGNEPGLCHKQLYHKII